MFRLKIYSYILLLPLPLIRSLNHAAPSDTSCLIGTMHIIKGCRIVLVSVFHPYLLLMLPQSSNATVLLK